MSLPGDRIPDPTYPEGSSTPAQDADVLPVWCCHSFRWDWDGGEGGYRCEDDQHYDNDDALPTTPGALPLGCHPHYAHPPNEQQLAALRRDDILAARDAILDRAHKRGWGL